MPREGEKVEEGEPLTKMEKKVEEIRERIQRTQSWQKRKSNSVFSMKGQLSLSKDLERSNLRIMPRVLEVLREWTTSWVRIMQSRICLPST